MGQYDFNYLPAEVVSSIYENFIQAEATTQNGENEKGVVYTPIHLVNLDPARGSGVFLVAAYKRLLQWWAINNSTGYTIQYPNSKKAKKI